MKCIYPFVLVIGFCFISLADIDSGKDQIGSKKGTRIRESNVIKLKVKLKKIGVSPGVRVAGVKYPADVLKRGKLNQLHVGIDSHWCVVCDIIHVDSNPLNLHFAPKDFEIYIHSTAGSLGGCPRTGEVLFVSVEYMRDEDKNVTFWNLRMEPDTPYTCRRIFYKKEAGKVQFKQAWLNDRKDKVILSQGVVGSPGLVSCFEIDRKKTVEECIAGILSEACDEGFREACIGDVDTMVLCLPFDFHTDRKKLQLHIDRMHELADRLDEILIPRGLGSADRSSITTIGPLLSCYVIDYDSAERVMRESLKDTDLLCDANIYCREHMHSLSISSVINVPKREVTAALRKYATKHGRRFAPVKVAEKNYEFLRENLDVLEIEESWFFEEEETNKELGFSNPERVIISESNNNTSIQFPGRFRRWDKVSSFLSRELKAPVFSLHIQNCILWMFRFYKNGTELTRFNPQPKEWRASFNEERMTSCIADAGIIASELSYVPKKSIEKYFREWHYPDDYFPGLLDKTEKAYPEDECGYLHHCQMFDFMRKLKLPTPLVQGKDGRLIVGEIFSFGRQ